jgi:two-component system, NtrC family, sensor kinase
MPAMTNAVLATQNKAMRTSLSREVAKRKRVEQRCARLVRGHQAARKGMAAKIRLLTGAASEMREQQTATSEILRVISSSPMDVQPVFGAIAESALRLCEAKHGNVFTFDGELIHLAALANVNPEGSEAVRRSFPRPPDRASSTTRAILNRSAVNIPDVLSDPEYLLADVVRTADFRSTLSVPMLRKGQPIGAITVTRAALGPFPDAQIELLQTFADQAVIAIENVRLFKELEEKNRALTKAHAQVTETLEQQTATSEILRVISSAHTDAQPVFDTIVQSAVRRCNAATAAVFRTDGTMLYHPANYGSSPEALAATRARYPRPLDMETPPGIAILTRSVVEIPDIEDPSAIAPSIQYDGTFAGENLESARTSATWTTLRSSAAGDQPEDRDGARPDDPAVGAGAGG